MISIQMQIADLHCALRQRMGSNAAEFARNYDWEKIAKQIVGVYEELVGKR